MLRISKKIGLRAAEILYEEQDAILRFCKNAKFLRVDVLSRNKLLLSEKYIPVSTRPTPVVVLQGKTKEQVLASFKKNTRNEIRRSYKLRDYKFVKDDATAKAYTCYANFERSQGRVPVGKKYFLRLTIFAAISENEIMSAIACIEARPVLKVHSIFSTRLTASTDQCKREVGYVSRRLVYDMCCYGIDEGYDELDLAYVNFTDPAKKGITNFKMQFNPEVKQEYRYIYKSKVYSAVEPLYFAAIGLLRNVWARI